VCVWRPGGAARLLNQRSYSQQCRLLSRWELHLSSTRAGFASQEVLRARHLSLAQVGALEEAWRANPGATLDDLAAPSPDQAVAPVALTCAPARLPPAVLGLRLLYSGCWALGWLTAALLGPGQLLPSLLGLRAAVGVRGAWRRGSSRHCEGNIKRGVAG
jgi:hypothetical protein